MIPEKIVKQLVAALVDYASKYNLTEKDFPVKGQEDTFIKFAEDLSNWDNTKNPKLAIGHLLKLIRLNNLPSARYFSQLQQKAEKFPSDSMMVTAKQFTFGTAPKFFKGLVGLVSGSTSSPQQSEEDVGASRLHTLFIAKLSTLQRETKEIYVNESALGDSSLLEKLAKLHLEMASELDVLSLPHPLGFESFSEDTKENPTEFQYTVKTYLKLTQGFYQQYFGDKIDPSIIEKLEKEYLDVQKNLEVLRPGNLNSYLEEIFKKLKLKLETEKLKHTILELETGKAADGELKRTLAETQEANKKLIEEKNRLEEEKNRLNQEAQTRLEKIEELQLGLESMTSEKNQLAKCLADNLQECESLRSAIGINSEEIKQVQLEAKEKAAKLDELNAAMAKLQQESDVNKKTHEEDEQIMQRFREEIVATSKELEARSTRLAVAVHARHTHEMQLKKMEALREEDASKLKEREKTIKKISAELEHEKTDNSEMAQQLVELQRNQKSAKALVQSKARPGNQKDRGATLGFDPKHLARTVTQPTFGKD